MSMLLEHTPAIAARKSGAGGTGRGHGWIEGGGGENGGEWVDNRGWRGVLTNEGDSTSAGGSEGVSGLTHRM